MCKPAQRPAVPGTREPASWRARSESASLDPDLREGSETSPDVELPPSLTGNPLDGRCRIPWEEQPTVLMRRAHGERCEALWRVASSLACTDAGRWYKRVDRILNCCRFPAVLATKTSGAHLSLGRCRDRLCPTCSAIRSSELSERIENAVKQMDAPRFMTLTIRSDGSSLDVLLARLRASFRRIRESEMWRKYVRGGIYAIETTYNKETGQWHPHVHLVWEGRFIAQRQLSAAWLQASGDSPIVDVRAIRSRKAIARYISKYVAKGVACVEWPEEAIAEYASAMHGARLVHTFGTLHGVRLKEPDREVLDDPERRTVGLAYFLRRLRTEGTRGNRILDRLSELGGLWARFSAREGRQRAWMRPEWRDRRAARISRLVYEAVERMELVGSLSPRQESTWKPDPQYVLDQAWEEWGRLRPRNGRPLSG